MPADYLVASQHSPQRKIHGMNETIRLRRSALYMPGSNLRAIKKARTLPADVLIFDLEDAVLPDAKPQARINVVNAVTNEDFGFSELVIRVNGLDSPWAADDLAAVASSRASAVLIPKIESADDVTKAITSLEQSGAPEQLALWVMIETPRAVLAVDEIATSHPRLDAMVMGTADLAKAMHITPDLDRLGLIAPLSRCVLAARGNDLDILDGIYANFGDADGLRYACQQGNVLGFDGKTLIHPDQIESANLTYGVSREELDEAAGIIAAWETAAANGNGIAVRNGQMIEQLHADDARRCIELAGIIDERS